MARTTPAGAAGSTETQRVPPVALRGREIESADLEGGERPPIDDAEDLASDIIVTDEAKLAKDYADELAFMAEPVEILLHRGREKFSPNVHDFYVNGKALWVPVETPTWVPRCYVEVMARAQPYDVRTEVIKNEDKGPDAPVTNRVHRSQSSLHHFSVLNDRNPRGAAWLAKVMRES